MTQLRKKGVWLNYFLCAVVWICYLHFITLILTNGFTSGIVLLFIADL